MVDVNFIVVSVYWPILIEGNLLKSTFDFAENHNVHISVGEGCHDDDDGIVPEDVNEEVNA